jgi:ribosomal-protein-alanine N-acetyltransferase
MIGPELETERIRLRPFAPSDLEGLRRLWAEPPVRRHLWDDRVISAEETASVISASIDSFTTLGFGYWGLISKETDLLIGFCGLRQFGNPSEIELLYGITPDFWGLGLATEAAREVVRYAFAELNLDRVYAGADPPNLASCRVMEKLGMRFARKINVNGLDALYYVILSAQAVD